MTKKILLAVCTASLLLGGFGSANAALIGVTKTVGAPASYLEGDIVPAPVSALNDGLGSNDNQLGFDELQGVTLLADLDVDAAADIGAGTVVNSHMILLNRADNSGGSANELFADNEWTFDGAILGVMSNQSGTIEGASSGFLGAAGTSYPGAGGFSARGLENNDAANDFYTLIGPNTLRVAMHVTQPGDWIRVVTAPVPVPSAMLLFGTGLVGLIAFRGMKKNS